MPNRIPLGALLLVGFGRPVWLLAGGLACDGQMRWCCRGLQRAVVPWDDVGANGN